MNEGILGQIANPQIADVAGALQYRKSRMDEDEAKRKELRMNQLIAEAIPNMAKDSPLLEIAKNDPQKFAMIAKVLNIPLNEGERFEQLRSRVAQLSALAESDPREAYQYAQRIQAENQRTGVQDVNLDKWLQTVEKDPITGFNALHVMNQSLNPVKEDVISATDQAKLKLKEREIALKEKNAANRVNQIDTPQQQDFDKWQRLKAEGNPDAEGFARSKGFMPAWGQDANTMANVKKATTLVGKETEDLVKYKSTLFDSINSNARTLNKYNFAIKQIDEGAESGPIMRLLPNLREQTVLVDVVRKEIGMEILGSGLLGVNPTDADVKFALQTSIPENLSPQALKKELQRRSAILQDLNAAQEEYYRLIDEDKMSKGDILKLAKKKREEKAGELSLNDLLSKYNGD